jgi:1-acyl-sn-glycerol-3-phosphate acyltransferase
MLRPVLVFASIGAITLALLPFQWVAVKLNLPLRRRIPVLYHRMVCAILGVRLRVIGRKMSEHPLLIVANHSSWLDVLVITAIAPVVFVAKREIADWPLFGLLAKLQRSVFVDRSRRHKTRSVNAEIARRLLEGDPVVLFGEGTSSDGNRVLPFRSALIGSARDALAEAEHAGRIWIQPLSLAYTGILGLPLGRLHRPLVAWYGDLAMGPHLVGIARRGAIDVTVIWGEPVPFDEKSDRKAIARSLEIAVRRETTLALRGRLPPSRPAAPAQPAAPAALATRRP